jgi:hypothetical protein
MQDGRERDHEDDTDTAHFWESFSLIRHGLALAANRRHKAGSPS